jgi:hypothetical protein
MELFYGLRLLAGPRSQPKCHIMISNNGYQAARGKTKEGRGYKLAVVRSGRQLSVGCIGYKGGSTIRLLNSFKWVIINDSMNS